MIDFTIMPPFAWIKHQDEAQVSADLEEANRLKSWPLLEIKEMPNDTILNQWKDKNMCFYIKRLGLLKKEDADILFSKVKESVFFTGYRVGTLQKRLIEGGSVIMNGKAVVDIGVEDNIGSGDLSNLMKTSKPNGSKIWVSGHELERNQIESLLHNTQAKIVFSFYDSPIPIDELDSYIAIGKERIIINATLWGEADLKKFVEAGASIVFMGDAALLEEHGHISGDAITTFYHGAHPQERARIWLLSRNGTRQHLEALENALRGEGRVIVNENEFLFG